MIFQWNSSSDGSKEECRIPDLILCTAGYTLEPVVVARTKVDSCNFFKAYHEPLQQGYRAEASSVVRKKSRCQFDLRHGCHPAVATDFNLRFRRFLSGMSSGQDDAEANPNLDDLPSETTRESSRAVATSKVEH